MSRSYLEELRRLVLTQTTKIGTTVANIHGGASSAIAGATGASSAGSSRWTVVRAAGNTFGSVDQFHQAVQASPNPSSSSADSTDGMTVVAGAESGATSLLLSGTITLDQARTFPIAIDAGTPEATFIVTIDGKTVRQGIGSAQFSVTLDAGQHSIEVMGSSSAMGVRLPADIVVSPGFDAVSAPVWLSLTTGYVDDGAGTTADTLKWYGDLRAGAWRVLRRTFQTLVAITSVGALDASGTFAVTLDGDARSSLDAGLELFAGSEAMGQVQSIAYDTDADITIVGLRLSPDRVDISAQWVGRTATKGELVEVAQVSRVGTATVTWNDTNVQARVRYEYALQARGLNASSPWSPLSEIRSISAGDLVPPASITFASGFPKVIALLGRIKFTTPADKDYAGVKIYYRQFYTGASTAATGTTLTAAGGSFPVSVVAWTVRITSGTGRGQERQITASTSTQITVATWATNPPNGSTWLVFKDTPVKTQFGAPNRTEDGTFELIDTDTTAPEQLYHFRAFDKAGNEQVDIDCTTWLYDPSTDPATIGTIDCVLAGGDNGIEDGFKVDFEVDFDATIIAARLFCTDPDVGGNLVLDIRKSDYASFPPTTSIVAAAPPTLASATKYEDLTLSGWDADIATGDILRVVVDGISTVVNATLSLTIQRHSFL